MIKLRWGHWFDPNPVWLFGKKKERERNLDIETLIEGNTYGDTGRILPTSQQMP